MPKISTVGSQTYFWFGSMFLILSIITYSKSHMAKLRLNLMDYRGKSQLPFSFASVRARTHDHRDLYVKDCKGVRSIDFI